MNKYNCLTNWSIEFIILDNPMFKILKYLFSLLEDTKTYKWAVVGLFALVCDYNLYNFLLSRIDMDLAKATSTFLGVNISFHFNRFWTFKSISSYMNDMKRYVALYSVTIIVNVYTNKIVYMILLDVYHNHIQNQLMQRGTIINIAYFAALCVSVIIGYFGQRLWVFKNRLN